MSAQKPEPRGVFSAILGMAGFSVLAGVLVTVMVTPAVAITGMTANNTIGIFDSLPDFIEIGQQPERNTIVAQAADGEHVIATVYNQNRQEVTYDQISQAAIDATVAGEDRRFWTHGGVDVASVVRAAISNAASSGVESGASTLTMQYVKNTYVQAALELPTKDERDAAYEKAIATSFERKLNEMKLAISLEKQYTKKEILTAYLNIAYFGDNTYGIEAASQRYYSVSAKDLTIPQAASLIAIVQYPELRGLDKEENFPANQARRDIILGNMRVEKMITKADYEAALAVPVDTTTLVPKAATNGCIAAWEFAKFYCDFVVRNVKNLTALGADETERLANWKRGGYTLKTTLDMDLQQNAQQLTWKYAPADETRLALGSTTNMVQVGTGRVLVMTQNKVFNDTLAGGGPTATAVNFSTDKDYGGSSGFQPGSTYKVFTLIAWLKAGKGLNESFDAGVRSIPFAKFPDRCNGPWGGQDYKFKNDSGEKGSYTVTRATQNSVNSVFIQMATKLDLCDIRDTAMSLGVHRADAGELKTNPSSVLGINEIAPLTMAAAYAGIANDGVYCKPIVVDTVILPNGDEAPGQPHECSRSIDSDVANTAAYAMATVMSGGSGSRSNPKDGVPIIGKTGTTDSSEQTWVVTATKSIATSVWVGNISGHSALRSYRGVVAGGLLRHDIMRQTIAPANAKFGGAAFGAPAERLLIGAGTTVPDVLGTTPEKAKALLEDLGFGFADGGQVDSDKPAGTVVQTDPAAGTRVPNGKTITIFTSNGVMTGVPDAVSGNPNYNAGKQILNDGGFNDVSEECVLLTEPVDLVGPDNKINKVVSSNPAPGTIYSRNKEVVLGVGQASC
jgi:membrane peptidoglycan carboxypeptidase